MSYALAVWQEENSLVDANLKNAVIAKVQLYLTNLFLTIPAHVVGH